MLADSPYQIQINPHGEIPCSFTSYLFNEPFLIQKQPCREVFIFYLLHKKKQKAYARFCLFRQEEKGISPCRGTFGSVEMNPLLPVQYLDLFIEQIELFAVAQGIREMEIKAYPFCYAPQVSGTITAAFLRQQYQIQYTELNYHLPVAISPFTDQIHLSEKRRLQKCMAEGFVFGEEKEPDLALIYQMIVQNRQRKGYPVTMLYNDFRQLFVDFPAYYKVFAVRKDQRILAVTVAVEISKHILYYFLPTHDQVYDRYSPMVLLIKGLYDYCCAEGFEILDLGIATDKGVPNYGLMRFKQNMGAQTSLKLSFVKRLSRVQIH
jgi:hypothetical protein